MSAEILCIGSELLLGEIVNTNASYISKKLADIGISCFYQTTVGDNPDRIKQVLDIALKRSDIIIVTGGLGPTDDDLTVQTIADYFHEDLVLDETSLNKIRDYFSSIKKEMPEINIKQAYRPKSSFVLNNPVGTAPGFIWEIDNIFATRKVILTFPGVPSELSAMWEETAEKYLSQYSKGVILTRSLKYFGIAEAVLAQKVKDLMNKPNPTVAPLVGRGEPRLRIAAKASSLTEANELIDEVEKEILSRTSEYFYGYDDENLEQVVGELLIEKDLTVSIAESCTGGLVSSRLTDISGSSAYTKMNYVTYSNEAKIKYLGINENIIKNYGAVSDKTAINMAIGARGFSSCDIGVGITGIAGPTGGTEDKPVGLVYLGICDRFRMEAYEVRIPEHFARTDIKFLASQHVLNYLRLFIKKYYKV